MQTHDIERNYKLIVTIVKKGVGSKVIAASKMCGAEGGTIMLGRGTAGRDVYEKLLGIGFEPEKEIVLSMVMNECVDKVINEIIKKVELNKPGKGIAFVIDVKKYAGIAHLISQQNQI